MKHIEQNLFDVFHSYPNCDHLDPDIEVPEPDGFYFHLSGFHFDLDIEVSDPGFDHFNPDIEVPEPGGFHFYISGFHFDPDIEVLSLIHISEPTRLGMISYAVFCLK